MTPAIYLDNAATSIPKAPGVADAVAASLRDGIGNPGRGAHRYAVAAARVQEEAREAVARLLGGSPQRTLLGPGATFWLNTVLSSALEPGDRVVVSALEHNAVMRPLRHLEASRGVEVVVVPGEQRTGVPSPAEIAAAARGARLVVLNHASNVSGQVLPVNEVAKAVAPTPVVVDAAQTVGVLPVDFASSGLAALACSGHKGLLGPTGIGVLLLAPGFEVDPLVRGGTGSRSESEEMPPELPDLLEAGTANVAGAAGLLASCRWLERHGVETAHLRTTELTEELGRALEWVEGVHLPGFDPERERVGVLSLTVDGIDVGELAGWLDREHGIMTRAGLHCAAAAHRRLGTFPAGTLRVSVGAFTEPAHLEALVRALDEARRTLRR